MRDGTGSTNATLFLQTAIDQVSAFGEAFAADRGRLEELSQRLRDERCHVAVLGQFKRGKSTLINALLGEAILPAAIVPVTSIPTFLSGGEKLGARVLFVNGKPEKRFAGSTAAELADFLASFVAEGANPHNRLGVQRVDVVYPAPVLQQRLALIDTPGIGSTFRHNTEATIHFLPQCDAALFVVSADPPITEAEVEFLRAARSHLAQVFFILNKMDYLREEERREALEFLQRVLCEQAGFLVPPPILCTSARQGLVARQNNDAAGWQRSGMEDVERRMIDFLVNEKTAVLNRAVMAKTGSVLVDVQQRLRMMVRALQLTLAELDEKLRQFDQCLAEIEEQRIVAMELLARDAKRLAGIVKQHADELLPKSLRFLRDIVAESQAQHRAAWTEEHAREAIGVAIPGFFEGEFAAAHQLCQQELRESLVPHRHRADELIASVHRVIQRLFELPSQPQEQEAAILVADRPYWRTEKWAIKFASIPEGWVDAILPLRWRHARIRRRIMDQVDYLASRNVGYIRTSLLESLDKSIQDFRDTFNERFDRAVQSIRHALDSARRQRSSDSTTAAPELARLESWITNLEAIRIRYLSMLA